MKTPKGTAKKAQNSPKKKKGAKAMFTVDALVEGDERLGVPTVDARQGKKFTRAGRKKSGRKPKTPSSRGRHSKKQLSIQEEVDHSVMFEIPDNARIHPTRAQLNARREEGYDVDEPELPDEEELPTDNLGEDFVQPMGFGADEMAEVETYDQYIARLVNAHEEELPIWDVRITTKQGWEWFCGDCNSNNMPLDPPLPTFVPNGPFGPTIPGIENMHPCVIVEQFIPIHMFARIAQETNAYRARCKQSAKNMDADEADFYDAPQVTEDDISAFERDYDLQWEDQSIGSIIRYLGMHIGMAIRPRRSISDYWSKDSFGCLTPDSFSRYMSRNRFNLVKKYFYINHAEEDDFDDNGKLKDPWHKVRPFITELQDNLLKNWNIGQWNSIDEGKIAYHGCCCPVLTYDRAKPIKWGMKVFMASCARTGYPWWLCPWAGESMRMRDELDEDFHDLTFGTRVVLAAAKHMPPNSHAFIDRYFTGIPSLKLAKRRHNVLITGTIKSDRPGIPWQYLTDWDQDKSQRGYYRWAFMPEYGMYATCWKDRNIVPMLSTGFGVQPATVNRGGGGAKKRGKLRPTKVPYGRYNYTCPKMVLEFNDKLRGVDLFDRKRSQIGYSIEKFSTCHKWWEKGFMGFLDIALTAAFVCWNFLNPRKNSHEKFMKEVHQAFMNNTWDETGTWGIPDVVPERISKKGIPVRTPLKVRIDQCAVSSPILSNEHVLVKMVQTALWKHKVNSKEVGPKQTARKRCQQCLNEKRPEAKTSYVCVQCNYTYLCKPGNSKNNFDCFRRWHVQRQQNLLKHKKSAIVPMASL